MIIVKKPFTYLRDKHAWKYGGGFKKRGMRAFMDLGRIMLLERREIMTCKTFQSRKTKKTTEDAKYITISLEDFLQHSNIFEELVYCQYNVKCNWGWIFVKLGLKVIKDAEICVPTKEWYPLIIRNDKYNFYIACRKEDDDND